MEEVIALCIADIEAVAVSGKMSLDMQVRAYDLLQSLSEAADGGVMPSGAAEFGAMPSGTACGLFRDAYEKHSEKLAAAFDVEALARELETVTEPLRNAMNEARFEAASAASLHEFAKEVFEVWQTSGVFARRRALRELRGRAGFRLESHRIGNYVAKTFDLMNEAQARFARSQQTLFAADVKYKIVPGIYGKIYNLL